MNIVIGTSIGSAAFIYEIIAIFGYLTFGSKVKPFSFLLYGARLIYHFSAGRGKHHSHVPLDFPLYSGWAAGHRNLGHVLLSFTSAPMP